MKKFLKRKVQAKQISNSAISPLKYSAFFFQWHQVLYPNLFQWHYQLLEQHQLLFQRHHRPLETPRPPGLPSAAALATWALPLPRAAATAHSPPWLTALCALPALLESYQQNKTRSGPVFCLHCCVTYSTLASCLQASHSHSAHSLRLSA